jgi:hypothetical protein
MREPIPAPFFEVVADLARWVEAIGARAAIIGGVAVALRGRPRATRDVDALAILPEGRWPEALQAASQLGFEPRVAEPLLFAHRSRMLLLRHVTTAVDVDVILGKLAFEEKAADRATPMTLGATTLDVVTAEDLIIMKAVARRPQDLRDIEGLLDAHPDADIGFVRLWVREFASALSMPEMYQDLDRLIVEAAVRSRR